MDILSDIMNMLRTTSHLYGRLELSGSYGLRFPGKTGAFLVLDRGVCFLRVGNGPIVELAAGDFVFLPASKPFSLQSNTDIKKMSEVSAKQMKKYEEEGQLTYDGGKGISTSLIAGCFEFSTKESTLLTEHLPTVLCMKASDLQDAPWTQHILHLISSEVSLGRPGFKIAFNRLSEVLLIHAIRAYFSNSIGNTDPSWLRALNDPRIGQSLKKMHEKPDFPWTVVTLAESIGMSRSAFASRFRKLVGKTPLDHLTQWRILIATRLICNPQPMKLSEIAASVGYESESSFRKVFRRETGLSPKEYRLENKSLRAAVREDLR